MTSVLWALLRTLVECLVMVVGLAFMVVAWTLVFVALFLFSTVWGAWLRVKTLFRTKEK